ncbi:MAG: YkgJ family cysteine cluster protein [Methanoregula sp.]|nr:YkgJ family cysteine cluster protein [Methanoregula sp.]
MATFECDHCGKCCRSFGAFIKIERKISDRDFYCRYGITNELFPVHVSPEYADVFSSSLPADAIPDACPFLRNDREGKGYACTCYPTRPSQCRDFRCYHMIIRTAGGEICGKVKGRADLKTSDDNLAKLWKEEVEPIPREDPAAWMRAVIPLLAAHGYHAEPVE